ncbi:MAG: CDP-glucose 4,6-dehydratase [Deltaproteobacteria bacterium]|nr:CDP-glucose 4,6-dehydratase [Deltaproteobacteria bacterium]
MIHPGLDELQRAYRGRRVLLTGHTGFKGGWLTLWLADLGAEVHGLAQPPSTEPSLFESAGIGEVCRHRQADVRDLEAVRTAVREARPEVIFHLAAQPLVRLSYEEPLRTLQTNLLGTAHLLEALRLERHPAAVVLITSDKCYENVEWLHGYREGEALGGKDPYSASKAAAEVVASAWRRSFFPPARLAEHGVAVATTRAGNVVGGGDWSRDRIVPDAVRALAAGAPIAVRNPAAVRPWQHVLEPLSGYLLLGARLRDGADRASFCEAWNFGPRFEDARTVREVAEVAIRAWGGGSWEDRGEPGAPAEAGILRLGIEKAQGRLGWAPRWRFEEGVTRSVAWYRAHHDGLRGEGLRALCRKQIRDYLETAA